MPPGAPARTDALTGQVQPLSAAMQLEDLTKSNLVTVPGLGLLTVAATELVPSLRPALKSAIKVGLAILIEAQEEAEVELIRALVLSTVEAIGEVLSRPADEDGRCGGGSDISSARR